VTFHVSDNYDSGVRTGSVAVADRVVPVVQPGPGTPSPFADVQPSDPLLAYIAALAQAGAAPPCAPTVFCPAVAISRGRFAFGLVHAWLAPGWVPSAEPVFADVLQGHTFFPEIQVLWDQLGPVIQCSSGLFCPDSPISRAEAAEWMIRAKFGATPAYPPGPFFADVLPGHPRFAWVQKLAAVGATVGCTPTTFCPDVLLVSQDAATLLVRVFLCQ
jgi:hypothetical protein